MGKNEVLPSERLKNVSILPDAILDAGDLRAGEGLLLLLRNALVRLNEGCVLELRSESVEAWEDVVAWCRLSSHRLLTVLDAGSQKRFLIRKNLSGNPLDDADWGMRLPVEKGPPRVSDWLIGRAGNIPEEASAYCGFVPRGAVAEPGMPLYPYSINSRAEVWVDDIAGLYEQAKAQQWNASLDIEWSGPIDVSEDMERAVCQLMTFLAENEYAALYIPAKFLPRINAQYAEVVLFLSTVINDEARHIEAFTKRALLNGGGLQYASALTEWSLYSLLIQEDYFRSSFLLHVLGEGAFLDLLEFIERHAPDPITAGVAHKARVDEGRHVAYGIAHARSCIQSERSRPDELVFAAEERAAALQAAGGENSAVMEALVLLAGGGARPEQVRGGMAAVQELYSNMHEHRVRRMMQVGLDRSVAVKISELHTPNFM